MKTFGLAGWAAAAVLVLGTGAMMRALEAVEDRSDALGGGLCD